MIFRTKDGTKQAAYGLFDSSTPIPRASQWGGMVSHSGERVSMASAAGLPAFLRGLRLIGETAAGLPFMVYRGFGSDRAPVPAAPQLGILRRPNPDVASAAAFWQYVFMCLPGGNGYIRKVKVRGQLRFMYALNPATVTPKYEGSTVTFEIRDREHGPTVEVLGKSEIIHIPGILLDDPYVGVSVVQVHRNRLGTELGRERFEGKYLANDASVGNVLKHPLNPTREQREEARSSFDARQAGANNAGRTALMWGGWELDHMPVSLQDAQFIESKQFSVQDIGRMLGIPSGLLNDPSAPGSDSPEQENMRLIQHGVKPWMDRLEGALSADGDLFPGSDWQVEMDDQGFLRADIQTRWNAYRLGRQGGWITANEIRTREGLPHVEGGDEIQVTPVGGAVNDSSGGGGGADGSSDDE